MLLTTVQSTLIAAAKPEYKLRSHFQATIQAHRSLQYFNIAKRMGNCLSESTTGQNSESVPIISSDLSDEESQTTTVEREGDELHVPSTTTVDTQLSEVGLRNHETTHRKTVEVVESYSESTCSTTPTIEDLKVNTGVSDAQLDQEIAEFDIFLLAGYFDRYKHYLDKLKLSGVQREDLKREEFLYGQQSAMAEALKIWRRQDPDTATYGALVNMALELGYGDVAKRICQYIVKNVHTEAAHRNGLTITSNTVSKKKLLQEQESLRQQVQQKDDRLQKLQLDLATERTSKEAEIQYLRQQIKMQGQVLEQEANTEIQQLKEQMQTKDELLSELNNILEGVNIQELTLQMEALQQELIEASAEKQKLLQEHQDFEEKLEKADRDFMEANMHIQRLERELFEANSAASLASAKNKQLIAQMEMTHKSLLSLDNPLKALDATLSEKGHSNKCEVLLERQEELTPEQETLEVSYQDDQDHWTYVNTDDRG